MGKKIVFKKVVLDENKRNLAITIAIALATIILSYTIYNSHANKIEELHSEIKEGEQRLFIKKGIARLDNIIKEYRKYLYKDTNTSVLRDIISTLARDAGVDIVATQPSVSVKFGNYTKISFKVKLKCSYNQLGKFIEKVERLSALTKIDEIIISEGRGRRASSVEEVSPEKETRVAPSLTISAYCVGS